MNTADDYRILRGLMPEADNVVAVDPKAEAEADRHIKIIVSALAIAERVMTPGFIGKAYTAGTMMPNDTRVEAVIRKALTAPVERKLDG